MKKFITTIFLLTILVIISSCSDEIYEIYKRPQVCFDSTCFNVEIVDTPQTRQQGLMYRERLGADEGMLFIFDSTGRYPFWMKNTLIYLDMIWIDSKNKVVAIHRYAEPCTADPCRSYDPEAEALYVLEISGGISVEKGINIGDYAEIKI